MKGILLAGGEGTRLRPTTRTISKHLIPIYDKPLIFYSLSTLMLTGCRDILIIGRQRDVERYKDLIDPRVLGVDISYAVQNEPNGIAEAFIVAERADHIDDDTETTILMLGDNLFFGQGLGRQLAKAARNNVGATVFTYQVADPQRYGVMSYDEDGMPANIVEKPSEPPSNWAVTGLYVYGRGILNVVRSLTPSNRGELEITDVNRQFLRTGTLTDVQLGRGTAWLDTGTHDAMLDASNFVAAVQRRQGLRIGDPFDVAAQLGYVSP